MALPNMAAPARANNVLPGWRSVFLTGLALWLASVVVTGVTANLNMIPTVVLLGSFLVPATAVVWYLDHYRSGELTPAIVLRAFIVGGVLGVLAVSLLESWLLRRGPLAYVGAGLIEELVKLVALVFVARGLKLYTARDGIVLGAAVGFGFAALESSGYALNSLIVPDGAGVAFSLGSLVFTELLRGVLAPVGHGLWTAILGGALFGGSPNGRLRLGMGVLGAFLLVVVLHVVWDSMQGIALLVTELLTATPMQRLALEAGRIAPPTGQQIVLYIGVQVVGLATISAFGLGVLWRVWHNGSRAEATSSLRVAAPQPS